MNVSVILAHPDPKSFNHAIAQTAVQTLEKLGHTVWFHDLYAEGFDPILTAGEIPSSATLPPVIQAHCDEIAAAQGIVIVHPNWWGQPPAILKGWIDRVIRPGVAYEFLEDDSGEGVPVGLLKAKVALVFNTSNTPAQRENEVFGDPLQRLWKDCIWDLCGVKTTTRTMYRVVITSSLEHRRAWLRDVAETIERHLPALAIRRWRAEDHDAVWDLHNLALKRVNAHAGNGSWDDDLHHVQEMYLDNQGEFLVGTMNGRIMAMGGLYHDSEDKAKIRRMRVHPDAQRQGFGQAILKQLEARAKTLGYTTLWLDTTTRQTGAQAFYAKNGYAQTGTARHGEFELLLYEKQLGE